MRAIYLTTALAALWACDPKTDPCQVASNRAYYDWQSAFNAPCVVETLAVSSKQIQSIPPEISRLTSLSLLYLNDNRLSDLPPQLFALPIRHLYLNKNQFAEAPSGLGSMPQLQSLDLGANQISHPNLGTMPRLRWLSLRNNGIEELSETFVTAPELGFLFLQENKMTDLPNVLGSMARLSLLDASANPLTALPESIGNLKQLQSLRLERCALTDLPTAIAGLDSTNGGSLRELRLSGNPISGDKRSQIQALVPKARIFW